MSRLTLFAEDAGRRLQAWLGGQVTWSAAYGLARTVLAIGTMATLALSDGDTLFRPVVGGLETIKCGGLGRFGLFCVLPTDDLAVLRLVAIALLLVVATGWRPRLTAVPHWWVTFSFQASATVVDGGDHVATVLTLLLLPVALTDPRRWHWSPVRDTPSPGATLVAASTLTVIRLQVAVIYLTASVAKLGSPEWTNGTAVYYWLNDPQFGAPAWQEGLWRVLLTRSVPVVAVTWGSVLLEFLLAIALLTSSRWQARLLAGGVLFHAFIGVTIGLMSFFCAMGAALLLYLAPREESLGATWRAFTGRLRPVWWPPEVAARGTPAVGVRDPVG